MRFTRRLTRGDVRPERPLSAASYVMIHGNYTENFSTAGCVAVPDSVMDILWQYVPLGTKVTIGA